MHRRGTEVDLRYGLRILEGISNNRRSCRVLRPVQEQCQQCIVTQTYPSARKAEEKSILQLCVLPDSYTKVLAQILTFTFHTSYFFLNNEATPKRSGFFLQSKSVVALHRGSLASSGGANCPSPADENLFIDPLESAN